MNIVKVKNYDEMSALAAKIISAQIISNPKSLLGLATGSSPLGVYENLVNEDEKGLLDFSKVSTVNLDEYFGLSGEHPQSYRYFMDKNLFDKVNINKENTHVPNGMAQNIDKECEDYEALINDIGRVDLQLLGIGHNGHIGFNEPCDRFPRFVHNVELSESTIKANARLFDNEDEVPKRAITMGIGTILKAKKILLIAGADKGDIIERAMYGKVTTDVPASILQFHHDVTIIRV